MYDLIYYFPFPIIPAVFIWFILAEKKYLGYSDDIDRAREDDKEASLEISSYKIKKYTQIFIVIFLLFLPTWSFSTSETTDANIRHEIYTQGDITGVRDPVAFSIGPTYDVESVKEKMEENPNRWLPDEVDDDIDLDRLTRIPGRLTVYLLNEPKRYVVAYTYLAPYPVTKIYGFDLVVEGMERSLDFVGEETFLYPERPDIKSIYGRL